QRKRSLTMIPVQELAEGKFQLSPGKHNQLQAAVIREFAPRFAPRARLLYFGDTAKKILWQDVRALRGLGFPVDKHGKLPDIVLYQPRQKWLYLIEVVTSHGPVSPKRHHELESLLAKSSVGRVYVSVFPDFREYTRHARSIAWETEIWIAEAPEHLIHYNGDKFMGPHKAQTKRGREIKPA
ncbi:MAG: BsuBI/PstI family type II restriction endonuclease, partial [Anaerolineales bacterium]